MTQVQDSQKDTDSQKDRFTKGQIHIERFGVFRSEYIQGGAKIILRVLITFQHL